MPHREIAVSLLAFATFAVPVLSQPSDQQPTFRTQVDMVELVAVVTGEGDRSLDDLSADDFELLEDGHVRELRSVRRLSSSSSSRELDVAHPANAVVERVVSNDAVADAPAFVLLLDDLNTRPFDTHRVIRAALGALSAIPRDALVDVVTTSGAGGSLLTLAPPGPQHVTRVREFRGQVLLSGPPSGRWSPQTTSSSVNAPCGVGSAASHSQDCGDPTRAARRAAVVDAVAQVFARAGTRRKVLFWFTEDAGVSPLDPRGTQKAQRTALQRALNADVAVYAINPREGEADFRDPTGVHGGKMSDNRQDQRSGGTIRVGAASTEFSGGGGSVLALDTDDMVAVPLSQLTRETGGVDHECQ